MYEEQDVVFFDLEIGLSDKKIHDLGAVSSSVSFHSANIEQFYSILSKVPFICGHNIVNHDLLYLDPARLSKQTPIDTLYWSPLLFPNYPYHSLLKNDKLQSDSMNNPLNDSIKAKDLFLDECSAFLKLPFEFQQILYALLSSHKEFYGFFKFLNYSIDPSLFRTEALILKEFQNKICEHADLTSLIQQNPIELAYALALISASDYHSITPPWLLGQFPKIERVIKQLCGTTCHERCPYCRNHLDIHRNLKKYFGYDSFRTYNGEPLQEGAAQAAVDEKSLLAIFPTGGGKSITFQLPALMAGELEHGLTVVISPLQALMKDQVDNLTEKGLVDAVTVNGLLNEVERAEALLRVSTGLATILYISPEQLRSKTIEKILLERHVVRFVIDEAHCFSQWGQDFRVDYLYIGDFIRKYQEQKCLETPIPVSCFTATAKQKVVSDICAYFETKLGLQMELFSTSTDRINLQYRVIYKETQEEKYSFLRELLRNKNVPSIVYVSRTHLAEELARKLTSDGLTAKAFHGQMESTQKVEVQEAFISNDIRIIVATSAFGMGVDKKDIQLVVHYEISNSLENYIQEAGRAGRDQSLLGECYILYNEQDLNQHFTLLNETKISMNEVQQIWKAIKELTRFKPNVTCSPLELARQAGWEESKRDLETRVKTCVSILEQAGYIERGQNAPHVYATGILARNMMEASRMIENSPVFFPEQKELAKRIIQKLLSSKSRSDAGNGDAESRVDYIADTLGIPKETVITIVNLMRETGILEDCYDMTAYVFKNETLNRSQSILKRFAKLEAFLIPYFNKKELYYSLKELNEAAETEGVKSSIKDLRTLLYYYTISGYITKEAPREAQDGDSPCVALHPTMPTSRLTEKHIRRLALCEFILNTLFNMASPSLQKGDSYEVPFSLGSMLHRYLEEPKMDVSDSSQTTIDDVRDALLYLSKIQAIQLEGGFLVSYSGLQIERLILDNKIRYKMEDYKAFEEYYNLKIQQIHIVGEYASLMVKDYTTALQFVRDYFQMDYKKFIQTYFKDGRQESIKKGITSSKYKTLFGALSPRQKEIIDDNTSQIICVAAGPGSGKTRVLVHKLASLLLLEDTKSEQLLMLTFSRAAAAEFKKRLISLIGETAYYVDIKTFHSYAFDLLGRVGSLEKAQDIIKNATELIQTNEVERGKITKTVLVIDEAQDMDEEEYQFVLSLIQANEGIRVIAVGDDDQNIYEFRGSSSRYFMNLLKEPNARKYELVENYRSTQNIVQFANLYAHRMRYRMKETMVQAVSKDPGVVRITHHSGEHFEDALVVECIGQEKGETTAILTCTNEEALQIATSLKSLGVPCKLIQTLDHFEVYDLCEVRYFIKQIENRSKGSPIIASDVWDESVKALKNEYGTSTCLDQVLLMISKFDCISERQKYKSDFVEFARESALEDFYPEDVKGIFVSTIHKAKGREFDRVIMLLNQPKDYEESEKRKLYVGFTRAKKELSIHTNNNLLNPLLKFGGVEFLEDTQEYPTPKIICAEFTLRDVHLDSFIPYRERIFELRAGMPLTLEKEVLLTPQNKPCGKLSASGMKRIEELQKLGYTLRTVEIRFIVAWKKEETQKETPVILPSLTFQKEDQPLT